MLSILGFHQLNEENHVCSQDILITSNHLFKSQCTAISVPPPIIPESMLLSSFMPVLDVISLFL